MLMIIFGILLYFVGIDIEPFRYRMCNAPNLCICISFNSNKTQWNHFYFIYQRCKEWRVCKMKVIICLFIIIICILIASVHHFWWIMFTFHRTQPMQCKTSRGKSIFFFQLNNNNWECDIVFSSSFLSQLNVTCKAFEVLLTATHLWSCREI